MKNLFTAAVVASVGFFGVVGLGAGHAMAQTGHAGHHAGHAAPAASSDAAAMGMSEGTVRRVDAESGKVTIAHGPLANLDMPPMTMTFRVTGDTSLDGLARGDKVRFAAEMDGDDFVVTAIEKQGE